MRIINWKKRFYFVPNDAMCNASLWGQCHVPHTLHTECVGIIRRTEYTQRNSFLTFALCFLINEGMKGQLKAESAAHTETHASLIAAYQELDSLKRVKVQLDEYRSQSAESVIQVIAITISFCFYMSFPFFLNIIILLYQ